MRTAPRKRRWSRPERSLGIPGRLLLAALGALAAAAIVVVLSSGGSSAAAQQRPLGSMFQDDQLLLYSNSATVERTLKALQSLGVDRLRVTLIWAFVAPDAGSRRRPRHFNAADPGAYEAAKWGPYERLDLLAAARHIAVDFNVTAPAPLWAVGRHPRAAAHYAAHYGTSAKPFGKFVHAAGELFNGSHTLSFVPGGKQITVPRVGFWTVWNEPNQPGWVAPQWRGMHGVRVPNSPRLYRRYADAAFAALAATGHTPARDTILIGELAPQGCAVDPAVPCPGFPLQAERPIAPVPFLQALYCLNALYQPLRGAQAVARGCPSQGSRRDFVAAHPALFQSSGFAHHPYDFFLPPDVTPPNSPDFVPLANLGRLETLLDRALAAYGVPRKLPIYLTEYGYESKPPNPFRGIPLRLQAGYLDQAEYLAWKDPRVKALSQFELQDDAPNRSYPVGSRSYWSTFQTGLEYLGGRHKPSFAAYRLPFFLPGGNIAGGGRLLVWGMLRAAPNDTTQHAQIQWRSAGVPYRSIATVSTNSPSGVFQTRVRIPARGRLRFTWRSATGQTYKSRSLSVKSG